MKYLRGIEEERKKEEDDFVRNLNLNDNKAGSGIHFDLPVANVRNNENKKNNAALRRRRGNDI